MNSFEIGGFKFTNDDVVLVTPNMEQSWKGIIELSENSTPKPEVEEEISGDTYKISINLVVTQTTIYEFAKSSESIIVFKNLGIETELLKQ